MANYTGIGRKINLSITLDDLPRADKIALATDILKEAGIIDAIDRKLGNLFRDLWIETVNKYLAKKE